jgi:hypothetical protein
MAYQAENRKMTNQPEVLVEGWRLFHLDQLPGVIHLAQSATSSQDLAPLAQLLLVRCQLKQGLAVDETCQTILDFRF